jgi:hypothetical protein
MSESATTGLVQRSKRRRYSITSPGEREQLVLGHPSDRALRRVSLESGRTTTTIAQVVEQPPNPQIQVILQGQGQNFGFQPIE